jgi:hypothetical protein
MADHENSTASLGCTEVSPVHHPVGPPIPEVFQSTRDGSEVVPGPAGTREKPFGVLDDDPSGSGLVDQSEVLFEESVELPEEAGASASEPSTVGGGDAGVLAGEASAEEVGSPEGGRLDVTDVSFQGGLGEVPAEHRLGGRVDLDHEVVVPVQRGEADLEAADPGEGRGPLEGLSARVHGASSQGCRKGSRRAWTWATTLTGAV